MTLTLSVLRCPDSAVPETRQVGGGEYRIGRGPDNDWVLPDPNRVLSKHHCSIEFRGGFWQVRDLSTNGTFLNNATEPIGKDQVRPLSDGDRLRLGPFEIEARIAADVARGAYVPPPVQPYVPPPSAAYGAGIAQQTPSGWVPPPDPLRDPMAPPPPGADIFSAPLPGLGPATPTPTSQGVAGPILPADFDPLAEPLPMPDHAPLTSDAFLVPKPAANPDILPDDWNLGPAPAAPARGGDPFAGLPDPFADAPPPAAPRAAPPPAADPFAALPDPFADAPPPAARAAAPPPAAPPPEPFAAAPPRPAPPPGPFAAPPDPFAEPPRRAAAPPPPAAPPAADPFAAAEPPRMPQRPAPAPHPIAAGDASAALEAFLAGAGIRLPPGTDPAAALHAAGSAFRAAIAGMRALLIARSDVKREFRIEQTMLRAAGNNPVKFAATDEAAMAALLTQPNGPAAVAETADDLTAHQIATIAATQAAARALLDRLDPKPLEAADSAGGLFGAKEKRLWEAYKKLHGEVCAQFDDDFDSAFGKAFARAYEKASRKG
jgi:type VI secretion system protein ImpI/type VI secretion system protein